MKSEPQPYRKKNNKALGIDNIPSKLYKQNIDWWVPILTKQINNATNNNMPQSWLTGIAVLIRKKRRSGRFK